MLSVYEAGCKLLRRPLMILTHKIYMHPYPYVTVSGNSRPMLKLGRQFIALTAQTVQQIAEHC